MKAEDGIVFFSFEKKQSKCESRKPQRTTTYFGVLTFTSQTNLLANLVIRPIFLRSHSPASCIAVLAGGRYSCSASTHQRFLLAYIEAVEGIRYVAGNSYPHCEGVGRCLPG